VPFTPYHFGPAALLALPAKKYIDIPTFVFANVAVDLEPLTVILLPLNYPLHGFCHTLLIGTAVGLLWGLLAYFIKDIFKWPMQFFQLPCKTCISKMLLSGILGVWLHIIFDSTLYRDIRPLWPSNANPLFRIIKPSSVYLICEIACIAAVVIFPARAFCLYRRQKSQIHKVGNIKD